MENFCNQKREVIEKLDDEDAGDVKVMNTDFHAKKKKMTGQRQMRLRKMGKQANKVKNIVAREAGGVKHENKDMTFVRLPMFDEVQKLVASEKIIDTCNIDTVGWASTKDPNTGMFVGNPQSQASKSREHLTNTLNFKNKPVTKRLNLLSACQSRREIAKNQAKTVRITNGSYVEGNNQRS